MCALLGTTEKVVRVISRGQVYEQVYLPNTPGASLDTLQKNLESGLLKIYSTALELLADSGTLLSKNTARRTLEAIVHRGDAAGALAEIDQQEDDLLRDVQACESRRSAEADNRMIGMLETLNKPIARIDEGIDSILERVDDRIDILEWISPIPFGKNHDNVKETRTPGTGEWLLQHRDYRDWEGKNSSVLFWLQGSPGTGKTYLTSSVIDRIQGALEEDPKDEGFAFFYCDRNEAKRAQPLSILQSFVRQLSTTASNPKLMQIQLRNACKTAREKGTSFRSDQCRELILASLNSYDKTILVIDALDECDPALRDEIIDALNSFLIESRKPVKIFISSRPDPDIKSQLESSPNVGISATDNQDDIKKYLDLELDKLAKNASFLKSVKSSIIDKLLERCQGMFQWASLQVHQIVKCKTKASVMKRLDSLPEDLQNAYEEIWMEIEALEEPDRTLSKRAMLWAMAACKPLTTTEILSAIRIDSNGNMFSLDDKVDEQGLLSLCNNFLTIDTQLDVWRFSHLSVVEFLEAKHSWSLPKANYHAAGASLSYFINKYESDEIGTGAEPEDSDSRAEEEDSNEPDESDDGFGKLHPFNIYMRHCWIQHLHGAEDTEDRHLAGLLKTFLGSPEASSLQYQKWFRQIIQDFDQFEGTDQVPDYIHSGLSKKDVFLDLSSEKFAIFAMCRLGLEDILSDWWESGDFDVSRANDRGHNLLTIAAAGGSLPICKKLVEKGQDVNCRLDGDGPYGSALVAAAAEGRIEVVNYLIKAGADVDMLLESGAASNSNALSAAISAEKGEVVKYLVQQAKADVLMHLPCSHMQSALGESAFTQGYEIIKILLDAGADANMTFPHEYCGGWGNSLLHIKISMGDLESVKFLVKKAKVDVNKLHEGSQIYPIEAAAAGNLQVLKFLVQEGGANVNALPRGGSNGSPLAAASTMYSGGYDNAKVLIEAGADIYMQLPVGNYGSALAAAARVSGDEDLLNLLIESGADPNMRLEYGPYGSALIAAQLASSGDYNTVTTLLAGGADASMGVENGSYGYPIAAAVLGGQWYRVDELINAGADVDVPLKHPDFGSPLAYATTLMYEEAILDTLIDGGADVNRIDPTARYGTALIAAACFGQEQDVERLIEAGADVNLKVENGNGPYTTALEAAQAPFSEEDKACILRLSDGSEFEAEEKTEEWGEQKEEVVDLLKEKGATV